MASTKEMTTDDQLAQLYMELNAIHDKLNKLSRKLDGDERQDAVVSAEESVSDAAGLLTHVTSAKAIKKLLKKK